MEKIQMTRKGPKRIVFDVSDNDHNEIKSMAMKNNMTMRVWLINAIADAIVRERSEVD